MFNLQGSYAQPGRLLAQSLHRSGLRVSDLASAVQKCPSCEPLSGGPYPKTSSGMHFRQSATGLMPENIHCQLYMALKPKNTGSHQGHFCTAEAKSLTRRPVLHKAWANGAHGRHPNARRGAAGSYFSSCLASMMERIASSVVAKPSRTSLPVWLMVSSASSKTMPSRLDG